MCVNGLAIGRIGDLLWIWLGFFICGSRHPRAAEIQPLIVAC